MKEHVVSFCKFNQHFFQSISDVKDIELVIENYLQIRLIAFLLQKMLRYTLFKFLNKKRSLKKPFYVPWIMNNHGGSNKRWIRSFLAL